MAQLAQRHLVRKTDFPLPPSSPFPSPSPSLQTVKLVLSCSGFSSLPLCLRGWLVAT